MDLLLSIATLIPDYAKSDPTDDPADQTSDAGGVYATLHHCATKKKWARQARRLMGAKARWKPQPARPTAVTRISSGPQCLIITGAPGSN